MVGYHKRSDPATMYAKAEIDRLKATGELGQLTYVRILMPAGDWIAGGFTDLIRSDEKARGPRRAIPPATDMDKPTYDAYIGFVNYYIHQVNLMRHLLGESYEVTYADPSGVLLAGASASGVACAIEMTPYRTTVDWQESALVAFEKGYVKLELPAPLASNRPGRVEILRDPGDGADAAGHRAAAAVGARHAPAGDQLRARAQGRDQAAVRGRRGAGRPEGRARVHPALEGEVSRCR